jgi:hypothetical protein
LSAETAEAAAQPRMQTILLLDAASSRRRMKAFDAIKPYIEKESVAAFLSACLPVFPTR